jgi:hemoglobin
MNPLPLYERLGGEPAIAAIVEDLYRRVLADAELLPFFEKTPMDRQLAMQREFLCAAVDGPAAYTGKPLAYVHQGRGITAQHFARFTRHLLDALRGVGVSEADADDVVSRLNTRVNEITGTSY